MLVIGELVSGQSGGRRAARRLLRRRMMGVLAAASLFAGGSVIALATNASPAMAAVGDNGYSQTYYVNDARDVADSVPGDGICATRFTAGDPAVQTCTLYAAIQEANALPATDSILIAPAPSIRQVDGSFASSALIHLNWNGTNNPVPPVVNMSISMPNDAGTAGTIDADTGSRYWVKHDNTTLDFQNRIGWKIDADEGPNVLLFTGKNQTIRNFSQLTSAESSIYVGSTAENFSVLNGAIINPATNPAVPSNYAVERSIVVVEGAKNTTVQNISFARAYWDAILLAPASNTSLAINGLTIDRNTWDQPANVGGYDPVQNHFLRTWNTAVSGNNVHLTNNTIKNWSADGGVGAVIEMTGGPWTDFLIRGNTFIGTVNAAGNPIMLNGMGATTTVVRDNVFEWKGGVNLGTALDRAWVRTYGTTNGVKIYNNQVTGGKNSLQLSLEGAGASIHPTYRNTMTGVGGTPTAANENPANINNNIYNLANSALRTTYPNVATVIDTPPQTCRIDIDVAPPTTTGGSAIPTQDIYVDAYIGRSTAIGGDSIGLEQYLGRVKTTQSALPATFGFDYTGAGDGHVVRIQTTEIATGKTSSYSRTAAATGADTCAPNSWVKQGGWTNESGTETATQDDPTSFRNIVFDLRTSEPLGSNGLDPEDITFSGTAPGQQVVSLTQTSATSWRLIAKANATGTVVPSIATGSIDDLAGNVSIESSNSRPGPINFAGHLDVDQLVPIPGASIDSTVLYNSPLELTPPATVAVSEPGTETATFRVSNVSTNPQGIVTKAPGDTIFLNQVWSDLVADATLPVPVPPQVAAGIVEALPTHTNLSSSQPTMDTIDKHVDVPVRAINNSVQDGTRTATLNIQVVSSDAEFDGLLLAPVVATVSDDDVPDAASSVMTTVTDGALADGTSTNEVKATIKKADGSVISNASVSFEIPAGVTHHPAEGPAVVGPEAITMITPASGEVHLALTSEIGGTDFDITATINGGQEISGSPQPVSFTSLPVDPDASSYNVSTGDKAADGAETHEITVVLVNSLGAAATGYAAELSADASPSAGVVVAEFTETATPGTYVATIASTVAGGKTVTAAIGAEAISAIIPAGQNVANFVAGAPEIGPERSKLTLTVGDRTANNTDAHTATIVLVDAQGNPITGAAASLTASATPSTGVTVGAFVEGADGAYTALVTSSVAGSFGIEAAHSLSGPEVTIGSGNVAFIADVTDKAASLLTVSNGDKVAGVENHTASVKVVDALGNPVSGVTVSFTSTPAATPVALGTAVSGADGIASIDFTSEVARSYSIAATIDGTTVGDSPQSVVFVAGPVYFDSETPSLSATAGEVAADGTATHTVTAHVEDQFGNPVIGATVVFAKAPELELDPSSDPLTATTDATGTATIIVTSTNAGTWPVHAIVNGTTIPETAGNPAEVSFSASAAHAANSELSVTSGDVVANGAGTHGAIVVLRDENNNAVPGKPDAFVITVPGAVVGAITETSTPGTYQATITSTNAGPKTVTATIGATVIPTPQPVSFIADAPDFGPGHTVITATTGAKPADGAQTHTATVTVRDANGNLVPNETVVFDVGTLTATSPTTVTSGADGAAAVTVSSVVADTFDITATVGGTDVTEGSPARVRFEAGAPSGGESQLAVTSGPKVADGTDSYSATVTVRDGEGNPVGAGHTAAFAITGSASLSAPTANTNAAGEATTTITSREAGSFSLSATVGGTAVQDSPASLIFVAGAPDFGPDATAIVATTGPKAADGTQTHMATVTVLDAEGNPVSGVAVVFTVPAPLVASTATTVVSDASGLASVTVTSEEAGSFGITATVGGTEIVNGSPAPVLFTAGNVDMSKTKLAITTAGNTVVADGVEFHEAQVIALDEFDNPVSGIVVDFGVDTGATRSDASVTTDDDGKAVTQIQATIAGTHAVSADIDDVGVTDSPAAAVFLAGPASAAHSSMVLSTGNMEADGSATHTATVTVRDQFGNTIEGVLIDFSVTAGATPSATAATSNATGVAEITITSVDAGTYEVASQLAGTDIDNGQVTFVSGAASAAHSTWIVTPEGPIVANASVFYTATVTVNDSNDNPVVGADVNFGALPNGLTMVEAGPHTSNAEGKVVVRFYATAAGSYDLSTYLGGNKIGATESLVFVAGEASAAESTINASATTVEANGTASSTITVTLLDINGNIVTDYAGDVVILSSLGTIGSTVSVGNGEHEAILTSVVAGDATVSFTLDGVAGTNTVVVTFVATPTAPVVNPSNGETVTGTADPGTTVNVKDSEGTVLCTVAADLDTGAFSCGPLAPTPADGDTVLVSSTNEEGISSADVPVTVDSTSPLVPQVNPTDGSSVGGIAEPGTTVTVTDPDTDEVLCTTSADAEGRFVCVIDPRVEDGKTIEVTSTDPSGNVSPPASVIVDGTSPLVPQVNPTDGSSVGGIAEPGTTVTVTDPDTDEVLCTTSADAEGRFVCVIDPRVEDGKTIEVTSTDPSGNVSPPASVIVDGTSPLVPQVNPTDGSSVGGIAEPGTTVTVTDPDTDEVLCTTSADAEGRFVCVIDPRVEDGKTIEVTSTDPSGNVSPPASVIVDGTSPLAPQVNPTDGSSVGGIAEPGTTVTVTDPDTDEVLCTTSADAEGRFVCVIDPRVEDGKTIEVTSTDPSGNVSPPASVIVDGTSPLAPVVDPTDGSTVTGTAEGGSTVTVTDGSGAVLCTATADPETGAFQCVPNPVPGNGVELTVTASDPAGNTSLGSGVTVVQDTPQPPTVDPTDGGAVTGCAVPGSTVNVYDANGVLIGTSVANEDCSFTVTLSPKQDEGAEIKVEVTSPDGEVIGSTTIRVGKIRMTLDVDSLQVGETQVATGFNFKPGEKVSGLLESNPVDLGIQTADANGTVVFRFVVPQGTSVGIHKVTLTGETSGAVNQQFEVNETPLGLIPGLPVTGTTAGLIGLAALLALMTGVGFVIVNRRHHAKEKAASLTETA